QGARRRAPHARPARAARVRLRPDPRLRLRERPRRVRAAARGARLVTRRLQLRRRDRTGDDRAAGGAAARMARAAGAGGARAARAWARGRHRGGGRVLVRAAPARARLTRWRAPPVRLARLRARTPRASVESVHGPRTRRPAFARPAAKDWPAAGRAFDACGHTTAGPRAIRPGNRTRRTRF